MNYGVVKLPYEVACDTWDEMHVKETAGSRRVMRNACSSLFAASQIVNITECGESAMDRVLQVSRSGVVVLCFKDHR